MRSFTPQKGLFSKDPVAMGFSANIIVFWGLKMANRDSLNHVEGQIPRENKTGSTPWGAISPVGIKSLSVNEWSFAWERSLQNNEVIKESIHQFENSHSKHPRSLYQRKRGFDDRNILELIT